MTGAETPHMSMKFFSMGHRMPPCLGWEVNTHMSGQSNNGLRVHNVKIKKFLPGGNGAHVCACKGYGALASTDLNFFFQK